MTRLQDNIRMRILVPALVVFLAATSNAKAFTSIRLEKEGEPESPTVYQKEIAPFIAESRKTYPEAKQRYESGLPKNDIFFVSARLSDYDADDTGDDDLRQFGNVSARRVPLRILDNPGDSELALVRVSGIDKKTGKISGKIVNRFKKIKKYDKGESVSFAETKLIDWEILHPDRSTEGNILGKFIASRGPDVDVSNLLRDQREVDMIALNKAPMVRDAIDRVFLQFFNDPDLKVERVAKPSAPMVEEWPSLARKYQGVSMEDRRADLDRKVGAIKASQNVVVEQDDWPVVAAYITIKKGEFAYQFRQYLHFQPGSSNKLDSVKWGMLEICPVKVRTQAPQPVASP